MATVKSAKVTVNTKGINTMKIESAPVVEDTISGSKMESVNGFIAQYPGSGDQALYSHPKFTTKTQFIVGYVPTLFGVGNVERVSAAIADFYNKVTGAALQSTSISYADLLLFFTVGKEWRILIKVMHKMIDQYNQVSSVNDAFGKKHFDSVFGNGAYDNISARYNDFVTGVNQLASDVNERFPMPLGNEAYKFESELIDKTFIDDPNGKGSLIDFKRNYRDEKCELDVFTLPNDPNDESVGWPFWIYLDRQGGTSRVKTSYVNFANIDFISKLKKICDESILEAWYIDVRPYIQHLQSKGMKSDNVDCAKKGNASGEWSPVYNPNVLSLIRNADYVGKLANEYVDGTFWLFEHSDGYVYEGYATYTDPGSGVTTTTTWADLHIMPLLSDLVNGAGLKMVSNINSIRQGHPANRILNLEDYPASEDMVKNSISCLIRMNNLKSTPRLSGSNTGGISHFNQIEGCGPIILKGIYESYLTAGKYFYQALPVTAIFTPDWQMASSLGMTYRSDTFNQAAIYGGNNLYEKWLKYTSYNFFPNVTIFTTGYFTQTPCTTFNPGILSLDNLYHDVDSLVYFPDTRLEMIFKEMAYHTIYDSAQVVVSGSK